MQEIVQMRSFYELNDLSNDLYEMIKIFSKILKVVDLVFRAVCIDHQLYDIVAF